MEESKFNEGQYVVFLLGKEVFGVEINKVKEIIVYQETTKIPGSGDFIDGIINLRGYVIPIFSLKRKFGFTETECTKRTRIVVVEAGDNLVGIEVDGVSEVIMIPGNVIEKPSTIISGIDSNYISGIAKMEDNLITLLDLEKVIGNNIAQL
ncbi:chemotaxis protein CheW [Phosphitispora sp. TUW77]|uniref:chemotaxis protein CheW n=1 Tax=Phosphitispora sp. TUW77 TaxID=3152361 RepID=UPI003AB1DBD2